MPKAAATAKSTAWALLVVSSEAQAETLAHQRAWADAEAKRNGWSIARYAEGVSSGKLGVRDLMTGLLRDLRALSADARPHWIIVTRVDRVGRGENIVETQYVFYELKQLGVSVWTREGGEVRLDTPIEQLFLAMQTAVAAQENAVRRDKLAANYRRKRAAGLPIGNRRPYGIGLGPAGTDVVQEPEASAVREAFRMAAEGAGASRIAKRMTELAIPHRYRNGNEVPVRWSDSRTLQMLRNRRYVGVVIDELTFERAARTRTLLFRDSSARRWSWPLSSALRCFCGRSMGGITSGPDRHRIRYYYCRARWEHGKLRFVRADALEREFVAILNELAGSPKLVEHHRQASVAASPVLLERALKRARTSLDQISKKRDRVWDLHLSGNVRAEDVQERLDAYAAERHDVEQHIAALESEYALARSAYAEQVEVGEVVRKAAESFDSGTEQQQRTIARAIALYFGGLCAEEDGTLALRRTEDPWAQRRRKIAER